MTNLNKLKGQVEFCLRNMYHTRDSDVVLMRSVRYKFYRELLTKIDESWYVDLRDLTQLPHLTTISRIRRKFNEVGLYISDDEEVRKSRRQNTEKYLSFLGYR